MSYPSQEECQVILQIPRIPNKIEPIYTTHHTSLYITHHSVHKIIAASKYIPQLSPPFRLLHFSFIINPLLVSMELPDSISPTANVRRSCYSLMEDEAFDKEDSISNIGYRSVILHQQEIDKLASKIANSIEGTSSNPIHTVSFESSVDECISNLTFASWDEGSWHYNCENYNRPNNSLFDVNCQKFERIALYIMTMDAINFCFWPTDDDSATKNLLEYEHLAQALKKLAERDDVSDEILKLQDVTVAESSYFFAPHNLAKLTVESFLESINPLLPTIPSNSKNGEIFCIPNVAERVRLLNELGTALLLWHSGSATEFIKKANKSADMLVHLILQYFTGFRDTAVDSKKGRWVAFYKRAQILVADLWAALGNGGLGDKLGITVCNFHDMDKITTFADYRVPQLLRNLGIIEYSKDLGEMVDNCVEIAAFCMDELYIRSATVVAVDLLVKSVRKLIQSNKNGINAVKMDWFLWNVGEILDREGRLEAHHKVRTIYY